MATQVVSTRSRWLVATSTGQPSVNSSITWRILWARSAKARRCGSAMCGDCSAMYGVYRGGRLQFTAGHSPGEESPVTPSGPR